MVHDEVDKSLQSDGTLRGALFWQASHELVPPPLLASLGEEAPAPRCMTH
jgi:hypothetical protein